ncbi:MAG TPA: hypothetical protein VLH79_10645 [Chthonomonadales bacterium]|nr:hypothetical protein [Chthonomonadales bacterium]
MTERAMAGASGADADSSATALESRRGTFAGLRKGIALQILGTGAASALALLTTLVTARLLSRPDFGALGSVQAVAATGAILLTFGGSTRVLYESGLRRGASLAPVFRLVAVYALVCCALGAALVGLGGLRLLGISLPEETAGVRALVAAHIAISAAFLLGENALRGADRFAYSNSLVASYSAALAAGLIGGAALTRTYHGAIAGGALSAGLLLLVVALRCAARYGLRPPSLSDLRHGAGPVGVRSYLTQLAEVGSETIGIFFLAHRGDFAAVAAVVGCQRIAVVLTRPATVLQAVLTGKSAGQSTGRSEATTTLQVARLASAPVLLLAIPMALFSGHAASGLLGRSFADAGPTLLLFVAAAVFRSHAAINAGLLIGQGCPWWYVALKAGVLVQTVTIVWYAAPVWGAAGVALAQLAGGITLDVFITGAVARQAGSWSAIARSNDGVVLRALFRRRPVGGGSS